jgi:hypothetical protein
MGINIIREEIRVLLDTINEQYAVIESYKGAIPKIEIDILQTNLRRIYECMNELDKVNICAKIPELQKKIVVPEVLQEKPTVEKPVQEVKAEPIVEVPEVKPVIEKIIIAAPEVKEEPKDAIVEAEKAVVTAVESIIQEAITEIIIPEAVVPEPIIPEVAAPKPESKKAEKKEKKAGVDLFADVQKSTLADNFKTEQKPLHERLSQDKSEKPLVEKIKHAALKDLKSSIGINERFLFINELFRGNMQQYNGAIEQLNAFTVATEAFALLESLKAAHGWENKAETYGQLEEFVMRKFLAG